MSAAASFAFCKAITPMKTAISYKIGNNLMSTDMPPPPGDFSSFLLWAICTLAAALAAMWKVGESKNARDIKESADQMIAIRGENAAIKGEFQAEIRFLREEAKLTEEARMQCEMDRARLDAECKAMAGRIENLEAKNDRESGWKSG